MNTVLSALVLTVSIFAIGSSGLSYDMPDDCAGVGLANVWVADGPGISCAGTCGTGVCEAHNGNDAEGDFQSCACDVEEPSCCHLVARKMEDEETGKKKWYLDVRGLCTNTSPDCADADGLNCYLSNEDQPVCLDQAPQPPQ